MISYEFSLIFSPMLRVTQKKSERSLSKLSNTVPVHDKNIIIQFYLPLEANTSVPHQHQNVMYPLFHQLYRQTLL